MKNPILRTLAAALALAALTIGCGPKRPVLHVYTWSDYIKPELVKQFARENNCRVVIDTYDSNESMYAKLKAGATGYDIIFPTTYMVHLMRKENMLMPLNHDLLPNLKNLDPQYVALTEDKTHQYSVPYATTITCLGYLDGAVGNVKPSWTMFNRADLKGRMTLLDDYRETIGGALKLLGYSINSTDDAELAAAKDVVIQWKRNIAKFENEQYKTGLASKEFLFVHGYSGDLMQVQEENDNIEIVVPREGSILSFDDMVIPAFATQPELAHHFINFILEPAVAAQLTEFVYYLFPNSPSYPLLPEEVREDPILFPPQEVIAKLEMIQDLGELTQKYLTLWDEIKAAD